MKKSAPKETKAMKQIKQQDEEFKNSGNKIKNGTTMIDFGRYKGQYTFSDLFEKDPSYCRWFLKVNEQPKDHLKDADKVNPQSEALLNYILDRSILEPLMETKKFIKNSKGVPLLSKESSGQVQAQQIKSAHQKQRQGKTKVA